MSETTGPTALSPRAVLARHHRAILATDPDAVADLYAAGAVHEYPFLFPGVPERYEGREAIRASYEAAWASSPAKPEKIIEVAVHDGADAEVLVVEQITEGTVTTTGQSFSVPNLLVLRIREGRIVHARDYMDGLGLARALGIVDVVAGALRES